MRGMHLQMKGGVEDEEAGVSIVPTDKAKAAQQHAGSPCRTTRALHAELPDRH